MTRALLSVAALLLAAPATAQIKIAYIDPMTGPFGNIGAQGLTHFQGIVERINSAGGALGGQNVGAGEIVGLLGRNGVGKLHHRQGGDGFEVLDIEALTGRPRFADHSRETCQAAVGTAIEVAAARPWWRPASSAWIRRLHVTTPWPR